MTEENLNNVENSNLENNNNPLNPNPGQKTKNPIYTGLLILNVILLIGLAILYASFFTNNKKAKETESITKQSVQTKATPGNEAITIAYINSDTLIANYQYAKDLEKELQALKTNLEKNFESQVRSVQNDYENYLKTGASLTLSEQKKKEESFKQRQQDLGKMQESMMMQIQQKQLTENTKLVNAIYAFIKNYNEKNGKFTVILKKSFIESPVLYIDENLDLTKEILEGLNKEYEEVKGSQTKK